MKLPNADNAIIPAEKLRDYLLSGSHPVGRFKAKFFAALGYTGDDWRQLDQDIRRLLSGDAARTVRTPYGQKCEVRGMLTGPSGRKTGIVTVWIVLCGHDRPRFITAYPGETI